jgi:hypothetical protein
MVTREVRALGERAAIRVRLVERVDHEVDQFSQAVGHGTILARPRA